MKQSESRKRSEPEREAQLKGGLTLNNLPLARIAHELRAPLNRINGFLDLLLAEEEVIDGTAPEHERSQPTQETRDYLQRVRASSEQLYVSLENLLCLLRAASGQLRLSSESLALDELIDSALEELEYTARLRRLRIEKHLPQDLPAHCRHLQSDSQRARQILRNVLANALLYTPAGGQIEIGATAATLPTGLPAVTLSISDAGVGIRPEVLSHVFEPFYRGEPPAGSEELLEGSSTGLGLGLSIARLLVELLGGTIAIQSAPGAGTTVRITLPTLV
ncbi:MAG: HAMP domain-containing histidine kinase [Thermogemmatispora sp.]|uniref:sensor histidine kinase n=1 Tax=Thermogemmatispora sp. TaxID=1968838 RepID=UPI001D6064CF|nr:HAMP domain-containing sensor histidine kinase [Thermogemmatispora sp.]MBX5452176.1 HAMP domain-containing histidine kinase [Thermogemmatispora sp.]